MNKEDLLKHVGCVEQIGGIRDFTYNDGKAKGVRVIEINTGSLCFSILPDRGMDIAQSFYKGKAISWISKTGVTAPHYYEKDGRGFLRGFYGGLITTCGFKNIGRPVGEHGLHGRASNIPAQKISIFADWVEDEYIMKVSGEMRENVVFGMNIVWKRTITTKLFSNSITVEDTIINENFYNEDIALCYHCNFGYPLVKEGAKIINVPESMRDITAPIHGKEEECLEVNFEKKYVTVGVENDEIGVYLTYDRSILSDFLLWKSFRESEYVVGLEPRTAAEGGQNIIDKNKFVTLNPFEEIKVKLKFDIIEKNFNY